MRRTISAAVAVAFLLAAPLTAVDKYKDKDKDKDAKHQCKVEYKAAKIEARKAATHQQRVAGVKAAKQNYKECLKRAKM